MWYNSLIAMILRSPLHRLVSHEMVLLEYTGRKSGKQYTTPVNYLRGGDTLMVVSKRSHTWWRNFAEPTNVTLHLCGSTVPATARAITDTNAELPEQLSALLIRHAPMAKYLAVGIDSHGAPLRDDVVKAASLYVLVQLALGHEANRAVSI